MKLLDVSGLAEYLNLSRQAVYSMVFRQELPFYKIGRRVRFNLEEIKSWLDSQKIEPNGENKDLG